MSMGEQGFPWRRVMEIGLGTLQLSPAEFWAATPREIAAAFPLDQSMPMRRIDLDDMIKQFPDGT